MAMTLGAGQKALINVTPMIDVLLVLLIIFMVVVNSDSVGLDSQAPQPPKEDVPSNDQDIVLIAHADGMVEVNREPVPFPNLEERLAAIFRTRGNHVVFVGGEPEIEFQLIVSVIDTARGVGLDRIALMPRQPSNL